MATQDRYVADFSTISLRDVATVGGKNASCGEMFNALRPLGIGVVDGFATTSDAYRRLLKVDALGDRLRTLLDGLPVDDVDELAHRAQMARKLILETSLPDDLRGEILAAYDRLSQRLGREPEVAVRSSATAEDLPDASFAGQHETYLNVRGEDRLLHAIQACYSSLFTDRAISYRALHGYGHLDVALSVGIQPMVRSDLASAGVIFTLDPDTGFRNAVVITGSYGLGEYVVQGVVTPDEWTVFKPAVQTARCPIIGRKPGSKEVRLVYADGARGTRSEPVPADQRNRMCLADSEVLTLAEWALKIEEHYSRLAGQPRPMDIEWAKDGLTNQLFILQARPETVHAARTPRAVAEVYRLTQSPPEPLVSGQAVGEKIGTGRVRVVTDVSLLHTVEQGDVLVAAATDPDWEPVMRRVAAIVTDSGGRTAHAAIVSRELGLPCIVGTGNATTTLQTADDVTVCCAEGAQGHVYPGRLLYEVEQIDASAIPRTRTHVMLNVGDPDKAFDLAEIPNDGAGLARLEFIISNHIGVHPMALAHFEQLQDASARREIAARIGEEDPRAFFVRTLSEGVGKIAAAFHPNPVIVRTSDFKTNEYARLLGGAAFEPQEENPMLGFRGASRYYDARYADGFKLECEALLRVQSQMGLTNVKVMIPFCRTVEEARRVVAVMAANGLRQGEDGLEIYAMCEIPSNVVLAEEFLAIFDGYSIGSNDLTQLVLGIDRDSGTIAHLFDERNEAVRRMISFAIAAAHRVGKPIGICGQAPSDYPDFAAWLVEQGITSISLNPDTAVKTTLVVAQAEQACPPLAVAAAR